MGTQAEVEVLYSARVEVSHADGSTSSLAWMNDEHKGIADAWVDAQIGARVRQPGEWTVTTMSFPGRTVHVVMVTGESRGIIITVTSRVTPRN